MNINFFRQIVAVCVMLVSFAGCSTSDLPELPPGIPVPRDEYDNEIPGLTQPDRPSTPGQELEQGAHGFTGGEFRAVWVASVLNLDFPSRSGLSVAAMKREIDAIAGTVSDMGLNAVIFQVRPAGDAFYESGIFPWSEWLTGEQGRGIDGFDPLAYWIEACHAKGIELHAWLNPYRIIHTSSNSSDPEVLAVNNPVRQNPALAVGWSGADGRKGLFLDPGLPEARNLIIDGIIELISKYDLDGIHFDDYFYPGRDFDDSASFALYGGGMELDDWRRENVNGLISNIKFVIDEYNNKNNTDIRWGISPSAIWKNGSDDEPLGIPTTKGQESYHALYADTRRWVTEGWLDYICPQIYWYIGFEIADFEAIFNWWDELCAQYDVDLYVGHAAYREFQDDQTPLWQGEMVRQLDMVAGSETAAGSAFYRYFSMRSGTGQSVQDFYSQKDGYPVRRAPVEGYNNIDVLSIGFPVTDATVTAASESFPGYNIVGASVADLPLFLNGQEVTGRTAEGFFHVFAPLQQGDNVFTFSQEGQSNVSRTITLKEPESAGTGADSDDTPATPAPVTNVTALDYATVTSDEAWVYATSSTSDGLNYMLSPGQRDLVTATSGGNLLRLSCGAWVRSDAVTVDRLDSAITDVLKNGVYRIGSDFDIVAWESSEFPAVTALYDGSTLTVSPGMQQSLPELELPGGNADTLIGNVRSGVRDGVPYYEFTFKEDAKFEGHYIAYEDGELRLYLKKRKTLDESEMPLLNIKIMLDAGHGGESTGAIGPLGQNLPEKALTLLQAQKLAQRLEELGASVVLTRDGDYDVSLQERVSMSLAVMPDLFISLHANSITETTNARNIRGFTVWYQQPGSIPLTELTQDILQYINYGTNRQRVVNQSNFVVCRPWWAPHVLFESSFMQNPDDFAWLIDPVQQDRYIEAAADVVLEYFR